MKNCEFILKQLSKGIINEGNNITIKLKKNKSGANRVAINLLENNTYIIEFYRLRKGLINEETFDVVKDTRKDLYIIENVKFKELSEVLRSITGVDDN
ncbi:2-succinylbenzoate--CoA ligase [Clostridium botulinum]|uniref:Single-stranded DNA-binding protein n=1 Tax=Clostridium botulinum TaxID=1491 RepID=A0A0A0UXE6_CLOBO|nr:hypothetical protein [Clostridium botulinum]AIW54625.1 single-stranded DNA-binding protein [Clostridium botulinum]AIW54745.1 single-stranded DNA-binding protein [Clostridium botulinum]AIW54813.1 single-stranded DNA-binding protein [Clostridium botulinum]AIW54874.1 single-stranded DNA-binding protein [Clostridium botulinum]MBY7009311.1 hypothetical protein [Clostridium botulinum]